jgi:hypothetical protein
LTCLMRYIVKITGPRESAMSYTFAIRRSESTRVL